MKTIEDKIELLEVGLMKTLGVLRHVKEVGYTAKNVQEWLQEELATLEEDMDWEEMGVEPVAWMVCECEGEPHSVYLRKEEAVAKSEGDIVVPLYDLGNRRDEEDFGDE